MKADKEIQAEDSPSLETQPGNKEPTSQTQKVAKPGFFKRAFPWVLVAVIFFIAGASLVYFTLYRDTNHELSTAKDNITQLSEQVSSDEVDLQKAKTDLSNSQSDLANANTALAQTQDFSIIYKFQADVNAARTALARQDPSTARQTLTIAGTDLADLQKTSLSADSIAGLQPQLELALSSLETDSTKAASAMDTLYMNLLLISGNIK
jgi:cytoskeletal protein RodZ